MSEYRTTPMAMAVHLAYENPVFGECSTMVTVDDEAGGAFLVISQADEQAKVGTVRMELEQLEAVVAAARKLIKAHGAAP